MFRSLKLRKKLTAIFTLVFMVFNIFSPAFVALSLPTPVHAQDSSLSLSYNQASHTLLLGSSFYYSLYYQTGEKIEAVTRRTGSNAFFGTASAESEVRHNVKHGIVKVDGKTIYFVIDHGVMRQVAETPGYTSDLSEAEEAWLNNPSTYGDLQTGVTYHAPFNSDFSLVFDTLPDNPGTITFGQITLSPQQIVASGALSNTAYELTSSMDDGTFTYSLSLPSPVNAKNIGIQYSEDGNSFSPVGEVTSTSDQVTATSLNHFTIFVVVDDGGTLYSDNGWSSHSTGYNGDHRWVTPSQVGKTATWTFSGATGEYAILPSWVIWNDHATNAHYKSSSIAGFNLADININQKLKANESIVSSANGTWSGWYPNTTRYNLVAGNTVTLSVEAGTNGNLSSDALAFVGLSDIYVDDNWAGDIVGHDLGGGKIFGINAFATIQNGINAVSTGGTINVASGTYVEIGQILINKSITLIGEDKTTTVIKTAQDTGSTGDSRAWFLVSPSGTLNISKLTLNGEGHKVREAIRQLGNGTINDSVITNIQYQKYLGTGLNNYGTGKVDISNTEFSKIERVGVLVSNGGTGTFSYNSYIGKGIGDWLDYGFDIQYGSHVTIDHNNISNNRGVALLDGSDSSGISVWDDDGTQAIITNNIFTDNHIGVAIAVINGGSTEPSVEIGDGNIFNGGDIGVDLENIGATGSPTITFGAPTFKNQPKAIQIADGISVGQIIDIRNVIFKDSGDNPITNSAAIENLVYHLSDASNRGLLKWDYVGPTAPEITSPALNGLYFKTQPILNRWTIPTDISGIHHYNIEYIYADGHTVYRESTTNSRNHVPAMSEQGGVKFRVQAYDTVGNAGAWSQWRNYYYDATAPTVPVLTWPIDGVYTNDNTPLMQWDNSSDVYGVSGYLYRVYYHCSNPSDFTTCSQVYPHSLGLWLTASEYQAGATADGVYYWQVRAQDNAGNQSAWSEVEKVIIDTTAPSTPTGIYFRDTDNDKNVACGDMTNSRHFDVYWDANLESDFDHYEYISYNANGSTGPIRTFTTNYFNASWWTVPIEGTYGVQIRTVDKAGNKSPWYGGAQGVNNSCRYTADWTAPTVTAVSSDGAVYNLTSSNPNIKVTFSEDVTLPNIEVHTAPTGQSVNDCADENDKTYCFTYPLHNEEVVHTLHISGAADQAGNSMILNNSHTFEVDRIAPVSIITFPDNEGSGSTLITNVWDGSIAGTATDGFSGITGVKVSIKNSLGQYFDGTDFVGSEEEILRDSVYDDGGWEYNELTLPLEGSYTLKSHAIDGAGNVESTYTLTVILDKTIPEVAISLNPAEPDAQNGWYKTRPEVTLTATDANNIETIEYQWDSEAGTWITYSGMFKPASEGAHVLYYRALDLASNYSDTGIKNIKWDQTELTKGPENISVSPNPTSSDKSTVTWDPASDNLGIDRYEVQWKLGDKVYTDSVGSDIRKHELNNLTEGQWTVIVRAFDAAGNSKEGSVSLSVDRTAPSAPTLTLTGTTAGTASLSWGAVEGASSYVIWYGTSAGNYLYGANVGNTTSYTVQGLGAGTYYFIVRAHDSAGNGSGNSNEVSTGRIAGVEGVIPGTPAEGFSETPAVLGDQTTNPELVNTSEQGAGKVLGSSISRSWFWWLPIILLIIYLIYRRLRRNK
jgi:hypothetical protein